MTPSVATTWTQVQLLENVLLADLGADGYTGLWDGSDQVGRLRGHGTRHGLPEAA